MKNLYKLIERLSNRDYIVEQGTSSNWNYRLWKSGRYEAEMVWNVGQGTLSQSAGLNGVLCTAVFSTPSLPRTLKDGWSLEATLIGSSSNSPIFLEKVSATSLRVSKFASSTVVLQNITIGLRVVGGYVK